MQIGNAITEKKVLDVLLQARDRGPVSRHHRLRRRRLQSRRRRDGREDRRRRAARQGAAEVRRACRYTEIWISEAQERMVLAVPPDEVAASCERCAPAKTSKRRSSARFEATGRLRLNYQGEQVGRPGRCSSCTTAGPPSCARPTWQPPRAKQRLQVAGADSRCELNDVLLQDPRLAQRLQQGMDHPPVRPRSAGRQRHQAAGRRRTTTAPATRPWSRRCSARGAGWRSAAASIRATAISTRTTWPPAPSTKRCATSSPSAPIRARIAILDNFCWGNTDRPEMLGSLVRAAEACHDVALAFGTPFISGKDSLNNEFHAGRPAHRHPADAADQRAGPGARRAPCVTMDLKEPGNLLYLVGDDAATNWAARTITWSPGCSGGDGAAGRPASWRRGIFAQLHEAIAQRAGPGLPRPERRRPGGGAGGDGLRRRRRRRRDRTWPRSDAADEVLLFSESPTRFLVEVTPANAAALRDVLRRRCR